MHEVSLVAQLVEAAALHAGAAPVSRVHVRHATTIPEDVLRQAFGMLAEGGPLAAAELVTEPFDIPLRCASCGHDGVLDHDDEVGGSMAVCPSCGELVMLPPTPELELLEVRAAS